MQPCMVQFFSGKLKRSLVGIKQTKNQKRKEKNPPRLDYSNGSHRCSAQLGNLRGGGCSSALRRLGCGSVGARAQGRREGFPRRVRKLFRILLWAPRPWVLEKRRALPSPAPEPGLRKDVFRLVNPKALADPIGCVRRGMTDYKTDPSSLAPSGVQTQ